MQVIDLLKDFAKMKNKKVKTLKKPPPVGHNMTEIEEEKDKKSREDQIKQLLKMKNKKLFSAGYLSGEHVKKVGRLMQISVTTRQHAAGFNSQTCADIALTHVKDAVCIIATGRGKVG